MHAISAISPINNILTNNYISKTLDIFFTVIFIFFGFDFGFVHIESRRIRICIKSVLLLFFSGACFVCFISFCRDLQFILNVWNTCQLCSYLIPMIILLSTDNSLFILQKELCLIDSQLRMQSVPNSTYMKLIVSVTSIIFIRILLAPFYCSYYPTFCIRRLAISVLFIIPVAGTEILVVVYYFAFNLLYCHLQKITEHLEASHKPVLFYHHLYKFLMDSAEKCMKPLGSVFSAVLLFATPSMMLAVYIALKEIQIKLSEKRDIPLMGYLESALTLMLVFTPVVTAGQLSAQCKKLKVVLHDKLLRVSDRDEAVNIERFIRYVEARPCRFTALKILNVDWSLPVVIVNLLVTYLIVIIQFTHMELVK